MTNIKDIFNFCFFWCELALNWPLNTPSCDRLHERDTMVTKGTSSPLQDILSETILGGKIVYTALSCLNCCLLAL